MKKGFTLIELIISLAIFSIFMLAISMTFSISLTARKMNDTKQSTAEYSQAIIEDFRALGYTKLDSLYQGTMSTGVSTFVFFNSDMNNFNLWFQNYCNGTTQLTGNVASSAYPSSIGNQFGALIKVSKTTISGVASYHIFVRTWRLDKGAQSQSVKDIYESR